MSENDPYRTSKIRAVREPAEPLQHFARPARDARLRIGYQGVRGDPPMLS
jgi:hypothetical protein